MTDPGYNSLLKWGVENSEVSRTGKSSDAPKTPLDPDAFAALMSMAPTSDADLMKNRMDIIDSDSADLNAKLNAFDDFEQLIENLDNANNLEPSLLWTRLVKHLDNPEAGLRMFAAWCIGTTVENNARSQERLLIIGAIPTLVRLATEDTDMDVRKKAVRAISCASRNFQPALDVVMDNVPPQFKPKDKLDAGDMDSVDSLINPLRINAARDR